MDQLLGFTGAVFLEHQIPPDRTGVLRLGGGCSGPTCAQAYPPPHNGFNGVIDNFTGA